MKKYNQFLENVWWDFDINPAINPRWMIDLHEAGIDNLLVEDGKLGDGTLMVHSSYYLKPLDKAVRDSTAWSSLEEIKTLEGEYFLFEDNSGPSFVISNVSELGRKRDDDGVWCLISFSTLREI